MFRGGSLKCHLAQTYFISLSYVLGTSLGGRFGYFLFCLLFGGRGKGEGAGGEKGGLGFLLTNESGGGCRGGAAGW